jgi:hypothetical protein
MWNKSRLPTVILMVSVFLAAGCGPGTRSVEQAIEAYCQAVQDRDEARLACLSAGASDTDPDQFRAWVESQYAAYLDGRDAGWVEIESGGIVMVKSFSLGRGTYYQVDSVRPLGEDAVEATMSLTFGYGSIDLSNLLPGTTFYVAGSPPGRIHPIVVPRGSEQIQQEVLASIQLVWTLVRQPGNGPCEPAWAVNTVAPVEDSTRTIRLEWMF